MDERTLAEPSVRMGGLGWFGCDPIPQAAAFAERRPAAGTAPLGGSVV